MHFLLIALGLLTLLVIVVGVFYYNRMVRQVNQRMEGWSGVEVQLKRRHDLVPRLVETVDAYRNHETELLTNITRDRSLAVEAGDSASDVIKPERSLSSNLAQVLMLAEAYPELKSNQSFLELGKSLVEIEENLQYARRYYNGSVRDLNILVESFPGLIVARLFNFKSDSFFKLDSSMEAICPDIGQLFIPQS